MTPIAFRKDVENGQDGVQRNRPAGSLLFKMAAEGQMYSRNRTETGEKAGLKMAMYIKQTVCFHQDR